jgi:hypothetical protein
LKVSPDLHDGGLTNVAAFLGPVTNGTSTAAWYCWVQTKGILVKAPCSGTDAEVVALAALDARTDGVWGTKAAADKALTASALEASSGGFADIMLNAR